MALSPHLLTLSMGRRRGSDIADLADGWQEVLSQLESDLNKTRAAIKGDVNERCASDMEGNIDFITENLREFISLVRHAAGEAAVNSRQTLEREVAWWA